MGYCATRLVHANEDERVPLRATSFGAFSGMTIVLGGG